MQNGAASKNFTLEECAKHNTEKDCWLVIHGKVYDVTEFLDEHPGGYDIVVANTGKSLISVPFVSCSLTCILLKGHSSSNVYTILLINP